MEMTPNEISPYRKNGKSTSHDLAVWNQLEGFAVIELPAYPSKQAADSPNILSTPIPSTTPI
jgi:hypothetical protein